MVGIFSSGSTGDPKCIWNSLSKLNENAIISSREFDIKKDDRVFIIASPWHVAGLTWSIMCNAANATWKVEAPYLHRIDSILDDIISFKPTVICTVPSVVSYICDRNDVQCKKLIFGGGTIQSHMYTILFEKFDEVIQSYGQTEAGGLISIKKIDAYSQNFESVVTNVGKPPKELKIEIQNEEIWLESPTSTSATTYFTGDMGYIDTNDDLHITGRTGKRAGNCNTLTAISEVLHK